MSSGLPPSGVVRRMDGGTKVGHLRNGTSHPHFLHSAVVDEGLSPAPAPFVFRRGGFQPVVQPARSGDHLDIYQLLLAVFQGPSLEEFSATQDDPLYEPTDRLIIKRESRLIAHAHLTKRILCFGSARFPVAGLNWLGTLPEYRGQGCASALLRAADRQMGEDLAVLGFLRTESPHFFRRFGWAVCGRHCYSRAKPRDVLSNLSDNGFLHKSGLNIRFWRHVEMPALMRIFQQNTADSYGALDRREAYWRWLISRKAYDQIIVAIDGPDRLELDEASAPIVGYAVVRGRQVVELQTAPGHPTAGPLLLARACGDLIEHDDRPMTLHAPADDPLHRFLQGCGGLFHHHESDQGEVLMIRLLDTERFLKAISGELLERARRAKIARPCELGLLVDGQKQQVVVTLRGIKFLPGRLGRSYLTLNICDLTRLLLGHLDPAEASAIGRIEASTQTALDVAAVLFPRLPLWRSPWDELSA